MTFESNSRLLRLFFLGLSLLLPAAHHETKDGAKHKATHGHKDDHHKKPHKKKHHHKKHKKHKKHHGHHGKKKRGLAAHEHGTAALDLAVTGKKAVMHFRSPAESFFGFEHEPKTAAQKKVVADGLAKLRNVAPSFVKFPVDKGCVGKTTTAKHEFEDDHDKHDKHHGHKDEKHSGEHSEVAVSVSYDCKSALDGVTVSFEISKHFPKVKMVNVQAVSDAHQKGLKLKNDKGELSL